MILDPVEMTVKLPNYASDRRLVSKKPNALENSNSRFGEMTQ